MRKEQLRPERSTSQEKHAAPKEIVTAMPGWMDVQALPRADAGDRQNRRRNTSTPITQVTAAQCGAALGRLSLYTVGGSITQNTHALQVEPTSTPK